MKSTRTKLKLKADTLASLYYRAETPFCELAGKDTINCGGNLQWAHIFGRANMRLRYEPYNKLILCAGHHRWYGLHPIEWVRALERWFPERLAEAEVHRNEYLKPDFEALIEKFK